MQLILDLGKYQLDFSTGSLSDNVAELEPCIVFLSAAKASFLDKLIHPSSIPLCPVKGRVMLESIPARYWGRAQNTLDRSPVCHRAHTTTHIHTEEQFNDTS